MPKCPKCNEHLKNKPNYCPNCGIQLSNKTKKDNNDKLSPTQIKAITSKSKKLIINAGPGAGKTKVLVERVKYLLNKKKVKAKSLLVITFTEKAAKEIEYRLNKDPEINYEKIDQMQIGTIHSFCRTFLRTYISSGIEVIDDEDNDKKILFIKKNQKKLFPDKYAHFTDLELKKVSNRFDEFASFDVNTKDLEKHILKRFFGNAEKKNEKSYQKFIDETIEKTDEFPLKEIQINYKYKRRLIAHNYLSIVKAYNKYKELYDKRKAYDFNLLQIKTRDSLKENKDLRKKVIYKNILIDEFQDTDQIQFEIFEMLAENSDSVTYVGDINQSIYQWRGSNLKNFEKLIKEKDTNGFEVINLLVNYRSPQNIVEFNNNFMTHKIPLRAKNQKNGDLYYLNSRDHGEQAQKIVKIIKYLKKTDKIKNYFDIGLLFRSTTIHQIESLLYELNANDIKYHIKGFSDFQNYEEVQAVILLLWYLSQSMIEDESYNLKAFTNENLNKTMFKLSAKTQQIIENYEDTAHKFSNMNLNELKDLGITNEHDLEFFDKLNKLKKRFWNKNKDNPLDLLNLYYDIFNITGYITDTFENLYYDEIDSNSGLLNLALISNKINDFMETYDRYDLDSFFEFILNYYTQYSSPANSIISEDAVQISTIHGAKGLEFPVVFICSLIEGRFPRKKTFKTKIEDYSIPDKFKYSELFDELIAQGRDITYEYPFERNKEYRKEEQRVLYVGLTRAQSTLIISHILNERQKESLEFTKMKETTPNFKELKLNNLNKLNPIKSKKELNDDLELSFTSLAYYEKCPRLYNLIQNYHFVNPQNIGMRIGTILHSVIDKINKEILANNNKINSKFIDNVINEAIESNPDLKNNETFQELLYAVNSYCNTLDINIITENQEYDTNFDELFNHNLEDNRKYKILESEYPFTIPWHNSKLRGTIDLILRHKDGHINLVDFKTSQEENIGKYIENHYNQLHLYYMAMKQNSRYQNKLKNTKLEIYSLGDHKYINIKLNKKMINKLNKNLIEVSEKINNKQYEINKKSCNQCLLKSLCCK